MAKQSERVYNGRYEIVRPIARGGMAEVYLAHDQLLDRPVALKVLFPELSTDPSFVERFRREAQAAANLSHPNIVNVYDWGKYSGTYFITMEYVQGRTLAEILRTNRQLTAKQAAEIASEVAAALGFAHEAGLPHGGEKLGAPTTGVRVVPGPGFVPVACREQTAVTRPQGGAGREREVAVPEFASSRRSRRRERLGPPFPLGL